MENKNPIWSRLWFIWVILTLVYLGMIWVVGMSGRSAETVSIIFVIGLFVPFGFWNGVLSLGALIESMQGGGEPKSYAVGVVALAALLVVIFGDYVISKYITKNPAIKVLLSLAVLLLVTMAVDFAIWGQWASLGLITGNFNPTF